MLQITRDAFINRASSFEPREICMISSYSQIASSRPTPMLDTVFGLRAFYVSIDRA
jgi:hypothetical protein